MGEGSSTRVKLVDPKTGERVDFLFLFRLTVIGKGYLNRILIPVLCGKAGVPTADVRGNITSHRARSTIASQLFNAKEPMTLFELQECLGHATPTATQHYAKITPTKLAKSYSDAGYFARNLRAIEVLVDQGWCGTVVLLTSRGSSTISGTVTARMIFSISALIAWPVRSARFIYQKILRKLSFLKLKRTCCDCARIFRWPTRNSRLWKMDLRRTNSYSQS
jgi:hypothetical protein